MKKTILLSGLLCAFLSAPAQSFRYGVKGGVNLSTITGKDLDKNSHEFKADLHAGIMVNILPTDDRHFSIQPELIYSRKGYKNHSLPIEIIDRSGRLVYTAQEGGVIRLDYLDLPIMLNYKIGILILEAGPQFSFLVGVNNGAFIQQTFPDGTIITIESPQRRYNEDGVRNLDFGIAAGLRLQSSNGVALGFRFNQGFVSIQPNDAAPNVLLAPDGFNQCFQFYASYLIPK